jgi:parallel beta-helix repeat protein
METKRILKFTLTALVIFWANIAQAATYTVDDDPGADFSSIQAAINFAGPGDTILVEAGTYDENVTLKSGVDVLGAGFETTIIRGGHISHVVYANGVTNAVFDGFAVVDSRQDSSSFAGIRINGGNLVASNNLVTNNLNGIYITGASSAIIRNNIVTINGLTGNGFLNYGIISLNSTPLITNNIISRTTGAGIYIGWLDSLGTQIINNTIVDNDHDGIWCYKSAPTIKNNIIVGNQYGIAASHDPAAVPKISYNDVWNNLDNYNSQSGGVSAPGPGDISVDPLLIPPASNFVRGYYLGEESPCIDAGDPNPIYNDIDGSRNDMGAYGGMDGLPSPGFSAVTSGFVFTTVGKIPFSEITQTTGDQNGLANVSAGAASDLYIYQHTDAPFGGKLWISGLFGSDPLDDQVRYYRIMVAKWSPLKMFYQPLEDALTKVLYTINPDGTVTATRETIGPLTNFKDIKGLYRRTDSGYWAHRDLKIVWNTGWFEDGLYSLTYEAYDSGLNRVTLPWNTQSRITLRIDNSPVQATIHSVKYDDGTVIPECGIINLADDTENLKFDITAWHANGFLRNYKLSVLYGKNKNAGYVAADQYVGSNDGSPPYWQGVMATFNSWDAMKAGHLDPWQDPGCAYQFHLRAWARTTNGFTHIRSATFNDHYYIQINSTNFCKGDLNNSGTVDGSDLKIFADEYGSTNCR